MKSTLLGKLVGLAVIMSAIYSYFYETTPNKLIITASLILAGASLIVQSARAGLYQKISLFLMYGALILSSILVVKLTFFG